MPLEGHMKKIRLKTDLQSQQHHDLLVCPLLTNTEIPLQMSSLHTKEYCVGMYKLSPV